MINSLGAVNVPWVILGSGLFISVLMVGYTRFVSALPKTRSGKLLRRAIQAVCEERDPGDLTTIEDPGALQQIRQSLSA